ncbi:hypothetical protein Tco_0621923 [Tanacetum coccineum]
MLESIAYQTYYAYAYREKALKEKYIQKKAESDTSPKKKTTPASKGLALLSEVALTEAEQIKLATKRSKTEFYNSHASGSGDGVNTHQDEGDVDEETDVNDDSEETESDNDGDDLTHPNLSTYKAYDEEEKEEKAYDEEMSLDQRVSTPPEYELTGEEENKEGDDKDKEDNQDTEYSHVILTPVPPVVQQQSSFVSSDLVSKFINPSPDIGIDSILNQNIQSQTLINVPVSVAAETPSSDTTIPQPPISNIQPLQQTPESTTTTTILTTTLPDIPNFASLFQFDQQVFALETKMFEFKQTNQFAEAVSLIPSIVDNYLASKMKEAVDVVVQLQTNKLREDAQAENQEFLNQVDSTMKTIIKEQVQAQVSKIMPKIEKYVIESLGAEVLVRSTNQPQTSYAVAASLLEFKLKKILIDKMEENKSINRLDIQKNLYNALVESHNSDKDIISS